MAGQIREPEGGQALETGAQDEDKAQVSKDPPVGPVLSHGHRGSSYLEVSQRHCCFGGSGGAESRLGGAESRGRAIGAWGLQGVPEALSEPVVKEAE